MTHAIGPSQKVLKELAALHRRLAGRVSAEGPEVTGMSRTSNAPDTRLAASDGDDNYVHIVSYTQWLLDRLRLKIPRALCGASLIGDPDKPDPMDLGAPTCPKCKELS